MHGEGIFAYGLWSLVVINIALFVFFIMSFLVPFRKREWRSMGVTVAFFTALFTEMYGFPLTIYLFTGILGTKYPVLDPFSHANGHLWVTLFGGGTVMMDIIHLVSNGLVIIAMLIQWPSIMAIVMAPILLTVYYRLSRSEEQDVIVKFGDEYRQYMIETPMFIPGLR